MAIAIVDLGWSPDTFWRATPHEFYAACELLVARSQDREV
ncbi:phage tail assembly chaperone [Sphingomonas montana]